MSTASSGIIQVGFIVVGGGGDEKVPTHKTMGFTDATTVADVISKCFAHGEGAMQSRLLEEPDRMALFVQLGQELCHFPDHHTRLIAFPPFLERLKSGRPVKLAMVPDSIVEDDSASEAQDLAPNSPPLGPTPTASSGHLTREPSEGRPRNLPPKRRGSSPDQPNSGTKPPRPVLGAVHIVHFTARSERVVITMTYKHGERAGQLIQDCCEKLKGMGIDVDPNRMCLRYRQSNEDERVFEFTSRLPVARDPNVYPELYLCPSRKAMAADGEVLPARHRPTSFTEDQLAVDAAHDYKERRIRELMKERGTRRSHRQEQEEGIKKLKGTVDALMERAASCRLAAKDIRRLEEELVYYDEVIESATEREEILRRQISEL